MKQNVSFSFATCRAMSSFYIYITSTTTLRIEETKRTVNVRDTYTTTSKMSCYPVNMLQRARLTGLG